MAGSFGVYLGSVAAPIVKRALIGLGIGTVTYLGMDAVWQQILSQMQTYWGGVPLVLSQAVSIIGLPDAIGIIMGALATRFSMMQLKNLGQVV